jgi:hypothetical protein
MQKCMQSYMISSRGKNNLLRSSPDVHRDVHRPLDFQIGLHINCARLLLLVNR